MKIVFTGMGGTGKTSLVQYCIEEGIIKEPFLPSPAQHMKAQFNFSTENDIIHAPLEKVLEFQKSLFYYRTTQESTTLDFVSDRAIIDVFIYTVFRCHSVLLKGVYGMLWSHTLHVTRKYDHIFYVRDMFPIQQDNKRVTNKASLGILRDLYRRYMDDIEFEGVKVHTLYTSSIEDRAQEVKKHIEK